MRNSTPIFELHPVPGPQCREVLRLSRARLLPNHLSEYPKVFGRKLPEHGLPILALQRHPSLRSEGVVLS
jgi:hypothetical protein